MSAGNKRMQLLAGPLRLLPEELAARLQGLLVIAHTVAALDKEDERELAAAMAELLDEALTYGSVPEPYASLLEAADRVLLKVLCMKAIRTFRRRWGRLTEEHRQDMVQQLRQAAQEAE